MTRPQQDAAPIEAARTGQRSVLALHPAARDDIQDLVTRRPLPGRGLDQVDPFLFLNHHGPQTYPPRNAGLPFGPHPHRGFETVTFILEGSLAHHDTGGGESVVEAGGVQWMTAGRGLIHAELSPAAFKRAGGPLEILQLWVNLPPALKLAEPHYVPVAADALETVDVGRQAVWRRVSGGPGAPVRTLTGVTLGLVEIGAGGDAVLPAPDGRSVLFYTVRGETNIGTTRVPPGHLATFNPGGDRIVATTAHGATLLYGHADPIGAPVVAAGPFVMNTSAEIDQAIADYHSGAFGPPPPGI